MNNEQCIEIAEKVWGETYVPETYYSAQLPGRVNSWSGFGRTVEAMENKGFCFVVEGIPNQPYFVSFFDKSEAALSTKHTGSRCLLPDLFEAIHLAALEAKK